MKNSVLDKRENQKKEQNFYLISYFSTKKVLSHLSLIIFRVYKVYLINIYITERFTMHVKSTIKDPINSDYVKDKDTVFLC